MTHIYDTYLQDGLVFWGSNVQINWESLKKVI